VALDFKSTIATVLYGPTIRVVGIIYEDDRLLALDEGKWVNGRFDRNIRIDRNTHFHSTDANGLHAHIYGRRDRDKALVAVKFDGSKSHGLGGKLHPDDAEALRGQGFNIPRGNIIEFVVVEVPDSQVLLEQFGK